MNINVEELCCAACQVTFWLTDKFVWRRQKDHKIFYCPNGHELQYPKPATAKRAKKR